MPLYTKEGCLVCSDRALETTNTALEVILFVL